MLPIEKKTLLQIIGGIATLYAFYPFIYSRMDNVANTGNKLEDDLKEGLFDGAMTLLTIWTLVKAVVSYSIAYAVIKNLMPDFMFKQQELPPKEA